MRNRGHIILVATYSLMLVVLVMLAMFGWAVYDEKTPDEVVFQIVGPAFQTIVGGFIGLITGIKIGQNTNDE